jgi:hypothetical protein
MKLRMATDYRADRPMQMGPETGVIQYSDHGETFCFRKPGGCEHCHVELLDQHSLGHGPSLLCGGLRMKLIERVGAARADRPTAGTGQA